MSESEVRKAQMEVDQSTARLEQALDHLVEKIEEGNEHFETARSQVLEMREQAMTLKDRVESAAKDPEATIQRLIGPSMEKAEHFLSEKARVVQHQARTAVEESFQDTQELVDDFVSDLQRRADDLIALMESRPYASWLTVFFMGCIAGGLFSQRIGRARRELRMGGPEATGAPEAERFPREAA